MEATRRAKILQFSETENCKKKNKKFIVHFVPNGISRVAPYVRKVRRAGAKIQVRAVHFRSFKIDVTYRKCESVFGKWSSRIDFG